MTASVMKLNDLGVFEISFFSERAKQGEPNWSIGVRLADWKSLPSGSNIYIHSYLCMGQFGV